MASKTLEHVDRVDERLTELLAVERRLEAQVQKASEEARRQVEAAQAAAADARERRQAELEEAAASEEQADLEVHRRKLSQIAAEGEARVAASKSVTGERIEQLARSVLDRLLEGGRR